MRDFFERQDAARRKTGVLVFYFICAVAVIVATVCLTVTAIVVFNDRGILTLWRPDLMAPVAGITLMVILCGSMYKILALRGGGASVAEMMGGALIPGATTDPDERKVLNVVEEMSIASGIPVPPVYIMRREYGINAFAAGFSPDSAVIGVTEGAVRKLSRDEIQGVVAHEFSHIFNGDMRLNIRLMGVLHGVLLIALVGESILRGSGRSSGSRSRKGGGGVLLGLALLVIGYLGVFFGKLIKSAVSRQREYLADASAVQFTRNPVGLAGALKKIGSPGSGSRVQHRRAEEASHMFFGNAVGATFLSLLATHPPLTERIRLLDPSFDGTFPEVPAMDLFTPEETAVLQESVAAARARADRQTGVPAPPPRLTEAVMVDIGAPLAAHLEAARLLLETLPATVLSAAREPFGARAVIYGLLLDRDEEVRRAQLSHLATHADDAVRGELARIRKPLESVPPDARLPLVDLASSALRALTADQYRQFRANVERLIHESGDVSLFEYTLGHVLLRHLDEAFAPRPRKPVQIYSIKGVLQECSCVLSALAHVGHETEDEASAAFAQGIRLLERGNIAFEFLPPGECGIDRLGTALERLSVVSFKVKRSLLAACITVLTHDARITVEETELFRAIAEALDCPVPLLVDSSPALASPP